MSFNVHFDAHQHQEEIEVEHVQTELIPFGLLYDEGGERYSWLPCLAETILEYKSCWICSSVM